MVGGLTTDSGTDQVSVYLETCGRLHEGAVRRRRIDHSLSLWSLGPYVQVLPIVPVAVSSRLNPHTTLKSHSVPGPFGGYSTPPLLVHSPRDTSKTDQLGSQYIHRFNLQDGTKGVL